MTEWKPYIKKAAAAILLLIGCFFLQMSVFSHFPLGGMTPNLLIMLTSFYGFMRGRSEGTVVGFFAGLFLDFFSGSYFGMYALIYLSIGYVNGLFRRLFYGDDVKLPIFFVGLSDLLYGLCIFASLFLTRGKSDISFYFMNIMMPESMYTVLISFFMYFLMIRIFRWEEKGEKRSEATVVR